MESSYKALFESSNIAMMTLCNGYFTDCNQAALRMFQCESKQDFRRLTPEHLSPKFQPNGMASSELAKAYVTHAEKDGAYTFEWVHQRLKGDVFLTNVQLSRAEVDGNVVIQAVVIDISTMVEVKQQHQQSEDKFQELLDFLPVGVAVNVGGKVAYANPALATMLGFESVDEVIGNIMLNYVHPDDRELAIQRKQQIVATGTPLKEVEERFLRKNGDEFAVSVVSEPITYEGVAGVLVVIRDISKLKESTQKISLLAQAFEDSSEPMMILDAVGCIEYCNPAALKSYGQSLQNIVGRSIAELRGGTVGDDLYKEIIGTINQGKGWQGELLLNVEGKERIFSRRVSPVFNADNHVTHQIVIDRDITEERKQQEQQEHTQRLESLGVMAGGIAHDFNNLLTVIVGNTSIVRQSLGDKDVQSKHLAIIEDTTQAAADLCRQMLAYSGQGEFEMQVIDLSSFVHDMMRLLKVSIHKGIVLDVDCAEDLAHVNVDVVQIQQVLMNLVINANDAIGEQGGHIQITAGNTVIDPSMLDDTYMSGSGLPEGDYVYLQVRDSGCGMSEEVKKRLFEPFYTTKFTGHGLGMSAVLGIIDGHQGAICIESEQGKGTCIRVLFPACKQKPLTTEKDIAHEQPRDESLGGAPSTVLVVDDEDSVREVACMILKAEGYKVIEAVDGIDGLEKLKNHLDSVDVVLLDMTMPRMGGKEAYQEMRKIKPNIKVIILSGYSEEASVQGIEGAGLSFMQKPYRPKDLLSKLGSVVKA